jgi:ribose transport system permease protein
MLRGRCLIAIGTNEEAVRLSGIDLRPIKLAVFLITGFLVACAAVIVAAVILDQVRHRLSKGRAS